MTIMVTGGAGFIGSALIRYLIRETDEEVMCVDRLSYAGSEHALRPASESPRFSFEQADICDTRRVSALLASRRPRAIVHLAAESHVDRSIEKPADFIRSNIVGTYSLLEAALGHWEGLEPAERTRFRFHHVSTDEVYGSLGLTDPPFREATAYAPNSPYAASKAASDHLVRAWGHTYGLPVSLSNSSNNFGPFQYPEKLIPLSISKALAGEPIPIYGAGSNVRDWIHVDDHVRALHRVLEEGVAGECYNISAGCERRNIDVVHAICCLLDDSRPGDPVVPHADLITFVEDRPGHDLRYAMGAEKIRRELHWEPAISFEDGLRLTVAWYLENAHWCRRVTEGVYDGRRLGVRAGPGARG